MPVYHSAPSCRRQAEAERAQFIILNRSQPGLPRSSSSLSPVFGRTPNASPESSRVVLTDVEGTRGVDISTNGAHYTEGLYVYDVAFQSIKTHLYVTICRHSPANQRRFRGFTCTPPSGEIDILCVHVVTAWRPASVAWPSSRTYRRQDDDVRRRHLPSSHPPCYGTNNAHRTPSEN